MSTATDPGSGSTAPRVTHTGPRPVPLIVGALLAIVGLPLLLSGLGLVWALTTQRDDDGFFTTPTERLRTTSVALTSPALDLGEADRDGWWTDRTLATVRLTATSTDDSATFVGIGPRDSVQAYLSGAPYDEINRISTDPFSYSLTRRGGVGTAELLRPPSDEPWWTAQAVGEGPQQLTWDVVPGNYTAVIMNADGTAGVEVEVEAAGTSGLLTPIAVGLLIGGTALVVGAALLIAYGARTDRGDQAVPGAGLSPASTGYPTGAASSLPPRDTPVTLSGVKDEHLSRGLWLVKWLLALPHLIILAVLWAVFAVLTVVAFVAILFTARYPRGIFDFNRGVLAWTWRVQFYATGALATDRYPPFTLGEADYPATLDVTYPGRLSRGLVLVKWWLLALPHLIIVAILAGSWGWTTGTEGAQFTPGGLIGALTLAAGLLLLFTGRYPASLFDLLMGLNRWVYRVVAYVALMTDVYPPFRLDQGPAEPTSAAGPPSGQPPVDAGASAPARGAEQSV